LSLLFTPYVHVYEQALLLLTTCLQQLPLHDSTVQNVLLAAAPAADGGKLQQLLARSQAANAGSGKGSLGSLRLPSPELGGSAAADTLPGSRARYATAPPPGRSGGSSSGSGGVSNNGSAGAGGVFAAAQQGVACSFVGGADPGGGRPMHWAFAQLLPWPERGPDGPAHHMIALQQVLFKGLVFPQTQVHTVQLFTLLAAGLCQLPTGAGPVQAPFVAGPLSADVQPPLHGRHSSSRDQAASVSTSADSGLSRPGTAGSKGARTSQAGVPLPGAPPSGGSSAVSSRSNSRPTSGTPSSHRDSRESAAGSVEAAAAVRASAGTGIVPAGGDVSARAQAARFWHSLQQEQLVGHQQRTPPSGATTPQQQQQRAEQLRQQDAGDASALSRSAPDFQGLAAAGASAGGGGGSSGSSGGSGIAAGTHTRQPADSGPAVLVSSCSAWGSLVSKGSPYCAAAVTSSSRKLPGTRATFQCMLGQRHGQLLVSIACIVPFFCSQLGQLEPNSHLLEELEDCMHTLAAACCTHGLTLLGSKLQAFAHCLNVNSGCCYAGADAPATPVPEQQQQHQRSNSASHVPEQQQQPLARHNSSHFGTTGPRSALAGAAGGGGRQQLRPAPSISSSALLHLMQGLCLQLSRALLPTYAEWLLRFWMGVLLLPGASQLHPHVLLLLRCLFDTPGLQLGPAAALLLDASFLSPLVTLSQVRVIWTSGVCWLSLANLGAVC
jgi:hypothetical protein